MYSAVRSVTLPVTALPKVAVTVVVTRTSVVDTVAAVAATVVVKVAR